MACTSCLCWTDIRRAIVAIGIFSMLTSLFQILVTVAAFTGYLSTGPIALTPTGGFNQIAYILYITLSVFDFFVILFALILVCGNERTDPAGIRGYTLPWLIIIPLYLIFESGVNIYYFSRQFGGGFVNPLAAGRASGFLIVPLVYWIIKHLILVFGYVVVFKHAQQYIPCCHCVPYYKAHVPSLFTTTQQVINECPYTTTMPNPYPQDPIYVPTPRVVQAPKPCGCGSSAPKPTCGCSTSYGGANVTGSNFMQRPVTMQGPATMQSNFTALPPASQPAIGYTTGYNYTQPAGFWATLGRNFGVSRGFWG